jgi:hypothetical protein
MALDRHVFLLSFRSTEGGGGDNVLCAGIGRVVWVWHIILPEHLALVS